MKPEKKDFIEQLGGLVLDHRFKRLSLRLLLEAERFYEQEALDFKPRWVSTYRLLELEPWLAIGEIAARLGMSHPAVIQVARAMKKAGLLRSRRDPDDARRRLLSLSAKALEMSDELGRVWAALEREQLRLFAAAGTDILDVLQNVSDALDERPLAERAVSAVTN
jgi:DNA-binding MarR family transcriptional regulator